MTCKILHVSDTHLGNRQYSSDTRRDDFAVAFQQAIDVAVEEDVDAVIHTGDLFDSRDPGLPDLNRCIDILADLEDAGIPFYGIVGNHERKMDDQYLDLMERVGVANRLDTSPTVIRDAVSVYGIDSVTKPAWHATDFDLEDPPAGTFSILCMHQLLHPPVPEHFAEHPLSDVLDRVNIDLDAIALGDYHEPEGAVVDGTKVWYAGSTERCSIGETGPRSVSLLEVDDGGLTRRRIELDTRPFLEIGIEFADEDGYAFAENEILRRELDGKVVTVTLTGDRSTVTPNDVRELVIDHGAAVCRVDDQRGGPEIDIGDGPSGDVRSADRLIEEKLAEENLSEIALELEQRVRKDAPAKTTYDDTAEDLIEDAQEQAFDEESGATTGGN